MNKRFRQTIDYALDILKQEPMIQKVILFGSFSRGDERWTSDIDLLAVCRESTDTDPLTKKRMRELRSLASPVDFSLPEADIVFCTEDELDQENSVFLQQVRKEGIKIWER